MDKAAGSISVNHEAIPGYMDAMTMDFPVKELWVWDELIPGVQIRADLIVDNTADPSFWLEN
ncbi:MAG TPA: redoxin, partial [Blastocatellia bacterium]|nr:redoxin [Blastocatellia bacterium]